MTDKETSLAFVERIRTLDSIADLTITERVGLLKLAKTAALIEKHRGSVAMRTVINHYMRGMGSHEDFHTAVRAVADKIKEEK